MWTQSKDLHSLIENAIGNRLPGGLASLEKALKTHRSDFAALLKLPVSLT